MMDILSRPFRPMLDVRQTGPTPIARVVAVGRTSMTVDVILEAENRHTAVRTITTTGRFVLVAIDAEGHPREVG
jgi:acyl-CoA hydrolase